jgi:hypothetical protein
LLLVVLAACGAGTDALGSGGGTAGDGGGGGTTGAADGSSGSTGTSGAGGTSGAAGTSGGTDPCGSCQAGRHCTGPGGSAPSTCVCTPASGYDPDSCAANQDGRTVCDAWTLDCRAPREYEPPNLFGAFPDGGGPNTACDEAEGYYPVGFAVSPTLPDGGADPSLPSDGGVQVEELCVQLCFTSEDCSGLGTFCRTDLALVDAEGYPIQLDPGDGGSLSISFCDINLCGPGLGDDAGAWNGDFFGPCDAHGFGDGTCLPVFADGLGLCAAARSDAGAGEACDPDLFDAEVALGCAPGAICYPDGTAPLDTGHCAAVCNAYAVDGGPYDVTCAGEASCHVFEGAAPSDGGLAPGLCR